MNNLTAENIDHCEASNLQVIVYQPINKWRTDIVCRHIQNDKVITNHPSPCKIAMKRKIIANRQIKVSRLISDEESGDDEPQSTSDTNTSYCFNSSPPSVVQLSSSSDEASSNSDTGEELCLDEDVYEVDKILNVRSFKLGTTIYKQYQVKWTGYDDSSWVDESSLNCPGLLRTFYEQRGSLYVEPIAGADNEVGFNMENWITPSRILQSINGYKNSNMHSSEIKVELFEQIRSYDVVYILYLDCHFYVIMHFHQTNRGYISDGTNMYIKDANIRSKIRSILLNKIKLKALQNNIQLRQDFCGSSAAALVITFLQKYKSMSWRNPLNVSRKLVKRLTKAMHKHDSILLKTSNVNVHAEFCRYCTKRFFKPKSLILHERYCKNLRNQTY